MRKTCFERKDQEQDPVQNESLNNLYPAWIVFWLHSNEKITSYFFAFYQRRVIYVQCTAWCCFLPRYAHWLIHCHLCNMPLLVLLVNFIFLLFSLLWPLLVNINLQICLLPVFFFCHLDNLPLSFCCFCRRLPSLQTHNFGNWVCILWDLFRFMR